MQLVKHITRGYGHAEKTTSHDGRDRYLVRFFDRYDCPVVFVATEFTEDILEFVEDK